MRHFIMTAAIAACCMGSAIADDAGREPVNEPVNERVAANEEAVRQAVKDYVAAFNTATRRRLPQCGPKRPSTRTRSRV